LMSNYYLAAQLPALFFDRPARISRRDFLAEAGKWLAPDEFTVLSRISLDDFYPAADDPAVLRRYKKFELQLRQDIARLRKNEKIFEAGAVFRARQEKNPFETERNLLKARWDLVEEIAAREFFNFGFMACYMLKLRILERLAGFDKEKGMKIFEQVCEVKA